MNESLIYLFFIIVFLVLCFVFDNKEDKEINKEDNETFWMLFYLYLINNEEDKNDD